MVTLHSRGLKWIEGGGNQVEDALDISCDSYDPPKSSNPSGDVSGILAAGPVLETSCSDLCFGGAFRGGLALVDQPVAVSTSTGNRQ